LLHSFLIRSGFRTSHRIQRWWRTFARTRDADPDGRSVYPSGPFDDTAEMGVWRAFVRSVALDIFHSTPGARYDAPPTRSRE
jgi:hypothetical protein